MVSETIFIMGYSKKFLKDNRKTIFISLLVAYILVAVDFFKELFKRSINSFGIDQTAQFVLEYAVVLLILFILLSKFEP